MPRRRDLLRGPPVRRLAAVLALALALCPLAAAVAVAANDGDDPRLAANPALARAAAIDPDGAGRLLDAIDEALRRPPAPRTRGAWPGLDEADEALLADNPLLDRLYAHDPAAALALLERVKAAGNGGAGNGGGGSGAATRR